LTLADNKSNWQITKLDNETIEVLRNMFYLAYKQFKWMCIELKPRILQGCLVYIYHFDKL